MNTYPLRIALIASLGGFLFGFDTAVISGAEQAIQQLWHLSGFVHGFTIASGLLGTVAGAMVAGIPAQKYGRKKVLAAIGILFLFAAIGCALTSVWALFVIARIAGGIAVGASSVVGPTYIAEIAPANKRGRLVATFQLNIVVGILIAFLSNYLLVGLGDNAWRWMLGVQAAPALLYIILLNQIPESPRWLMLQGRDDEAKKIFEKTGEPDVVKEMIDIRQSLHTGKSESVFNKKFRKPIIFAVLLAMFNQLSGINAILYFAPRIFEMAGVPKGAVAFQQAIYVGAANVIFTLLAMSVIDKFGRKTLLLIGSAGMVIFLGLTAYVFHSNIAITTQAATTAVIKNFTAEKQGDKNELNWQIAIQPVKNNFDIERSGDNSTWAKIGEGYDKSTLAEGEDSTAYQFIDSVPLQTANYYRVKMHDSNNAYSNVLELAASGFWNGGMVKWLLVGFIAFFAFSQGAVIWVFISEIFPNSVRSQGQALGSSTHWIMDTIITWTFPVVVTGSVSGGFYSFVFYTAMMFLCLLFAWRMLPETKGRSLEEIQKDLGIA